MFPEYSTNLKHTASHLLRQSWDCPATGKGKLMNETAENVAERRRPAVSKSVDFIKERKPSNTTGPNCNRFPAIENALSVIIRDRRLQDSPESQ